MIRRVWMAALVVGTVAAMGPLGHVGVAAAQHVRATKPLYKANWTHGKNHWNLGPGFSVKKGKLVFNGSDQFGSQPALSPFTKSPTNFAVVTKVTLGAPKNINEANVGLLVRGSQDQGLSFVYRHSASDNFTDGVYDSPEIEYYTGSLAGFVPGDVSNPLSAGKHTLRVEVEGSTYRMLFDGKQAVPWTTLSEGDLHGFIGITASGIPFTVSSFQILPLKAQTVSAVNSPDVLGSHALTASDAGVTNDGRFFADDWWVAKLDSTTLDAVTGSGLVYSLAQNLFNDQTNVWQYLDQFQTADAAKAHYQSDFSYFTDPKNLPSGTQTLDTSGLGVGEQSFGFSRQFQASDGTNVYEEVLFFQRGAYFTEIDVQSTNQATLAQQAQAIFKAADQHLQS